MIHRDYASSPRNPSIPPSSFWAQRSAQPVGINKRVLSECIRIVIVAVGSAPILAYGRFAHRLRWAAAQTCLGISSPNPFFASRLFKKLSQQSIPIPNQKGPLLRSLNLFLRDPLFPDIRTIAHRRQPAIADDRQLEQLRLFHQSVQNGVPALRIGNHALAECL